MSDAVHTYTQPDIGQHDGAAVHRSRNISTGRICSPRRRPCVSRRSIAQGWPHASLLSAGDMLAMPSGRIRFVVFAQSTTTANLMRDGRVTVTLSLDGGMCELRMKCRALAHASSDAPLAFFEAELVEVRCPSGTLCRGHRRGHFRAP